jgi:hypothetical protein
MMRLNQDEPARCANTKPALVASNVRTPPRGDVTHESNDVYESMYFQSTLLPKGNAEQCICRKVRKNV